MLCTPLGNVNSYIEQGLVFSNIHMHSCMIQFNNECICVYNSTCEA